MPSSLRSSSIDSWESRNSAHGFDQSSSPDQTCLGHKSEIEKAAELNDSTTYVPQLFRTLGLHSVYLGYRELRGDTLYETKVKPIIDDRGAVLVAWLLHIPPLLADTSLLGLNLHGYYIGGELQGQTNQDQIKLFGLQIASKVLELWRTASIIAIVSTFLRKKLVLGNGIPFGALTTEFNIANVSYLWSREFIATCRSSFATGWAKRLWIMGLITTSLLCLFGGPSGATLVKPNLTNWEAGGSVLWLNMSSLDMWPTNVSSNSSVSSDDALTSSFFTSLSNQFLRYWPKSNQVDWADMEMIESFAITGRKALRNLYVSSRGPFVFSPDLTCSTVPQATIADALAAGRVLWEFSNDSSCSRRGGHFCQYKDIIWSIEAWQPATYIRCNANTSATTPSFPVLGSSFRNYANKEPSNNISQSSDWLSRLTSNGRAANIQWVNLDSEEFGGSKLGAIVVIPSLPNGSGYTDQFSCTIDARWILQEASVSFINRPRMISGEPKEYFKYGELNTLFGDRIRQVNIDPAWASSINPIAIGSNTTMFDSLIKTFYLSRPDGTQPLELINAIEAILASMLSHGLSTIGHDATFQGTLKATEKNPTLWHQEMLPQGTVYGPGGSAYNLSAPGSNPLQEIQLTAMINGYGYGISASTILSSMVLILYLLLVVPFLMYLLLVEQIVSYSWNDYSEMLALAMNSPPPTALENTGAGISTIATLGILTRVKERHDEKNDEKHVQLIVGKSAGHEGKPIKVNTFYG